MMMMLMMRMMMMMVIVRSTAFGYKKDAKVAGEKLAQTEGAEVEVSP